MVLTVTVSLAIVCAPAPVGVTFTLTVGPLVKAVMTELMFELIVELDVAAPATAGIPSTAMSKAIAEIPATEFLDLDRIFLYTGRSLF